MLIAIVDKVKAGFSLLELMVVVAIVSLTLVVTIPLFRTEIYKVNNSKVVNKLGTFTNGLVDTYIGTGAWPATLNGTAAGATSVNTFYPNVGYFNYTTSGNQAIFGYQLTSDYGYGWILLVIQANDDGSIVTHCGFYDTSCTFGSCNSTPYYPSSCDETLSTLDTPAPTPAGGTGGAGDQTQGGQIE